jgi:hypothetical protein
LIFLVQSFSLGWPLSFGNGDGVWNGFWSANTAAVDTIDILSILAFSSWQIDGNG